MTGASTKFILASHGWSASKWVAHALNRHDQIACGHSSAAVLAAEAGDYDPQITKMLPALRQGYVGRQTQPIADRYAALAALKPAPILGTVHTYRLRDLPSQAARFPPESPYVVMNLVRHPLDLVISGAGQFETLFRADLNELAWTLRKVVDQGLEIVEDIASRHGLMPGDHVAFFGAAVVLGSLRLDLDASLAAWDYRGTVRMEDVTQDRRAFAKMVATLTDRDDLDTPAYLDAVFDQGAMNRHAAKGAVRNWEALAPWQQETFAAFFKKFALRAPYEAMGYDFSFLDTEEGSVHG